MKRCIVIWLLVASACSLAHCESLRGAGALVEDLSSASRSLLQATTTTVCPAIKSCKRCVVSPTTGVNTCSVCKTGYKATKDNLNCVCPAGRYERCTVSDCSCVPCGKGFYCPGGDMTSGNNAAATASGVRKSCIRGEVNSADTSDSVAANGLTTNTNVATSSVQCVVVGGWRLVDAAESTQHAEKCTGASFSQGLTRQRQCTKCMVGLERDETLAAGTLQTSSNQVCRVPAGSYLSGSTVKKCLVGTYRVGQAAPTSLAASACTQCPTGWTTKSIGSKLASDCSEGRPGYQLSYGSTAASLCPYGTYYPGGSVTAETTNTCITCPGSSLTSRTGATANTECMVPPGYYIKGNALAKCPEQATVAGKTSGYYRSGWVSYLNAAVTESADGDGTKACKSCGAGVLSQWVEEDVNPNAVEGSKVAVSDLSCYITPGMGMSLDMDNKGYYKAYQCAANTFSTAISEAQEADTPASRIYGLRSAICQPCKAGLYSSAGSTSVDQCVVPAGWGLNADGTASQCADGFWSAGGAHDDRCNQCPVGRTTAHDSTSPATEQNAETSCFVEPGMGLHFNGLPVGSDAWLVPQSVTMIPATAFLDETVASVLECPVGYYGLGGSTTAINSLCQKCPAGATTKQSGSSSADKCDGCLAGYGNVAVGAETLSCRACAYGQYQEYNGADAACSHCPATTFNFPGDAPYTSIGTTLTIATTFSLQCVARATQLDYDTGFGFGLEAAQGWQTAGSAAPPGSANPGAATNTMAGCIDACPVDKCCFAKLEYDSGSTATGTCKTLSYQVVEPFTAPATGFQLFYKMAPSDATTTAVKASSAMVKSIASGIYSQCSVSGDTSEAALLNLGGSMAQTGPGAWQTNTRAECQTQCDNSAACWGFFYHDGKCLLRTGVKTTGARSFFVAAAAPECTGNSYATIGMSSCRQCTGGVVNEARNDCTFPPQPATGLALVSSATQTTATVSWTTPTPANDNKVVSYELRCMSALSTSCRDVAAGNAATGLDPSATQATVTGLNANVNYKCYVIAYNLASPLPNSGVCSAAFSVHTAS